MPGPKDKIESPSAVSLHSSELCPLQSKFLLPEPTSSQCWFFLWETEL